MEEFCLLLKNEDSAILNKVKTISELCDDIVEHSPHLFEKFCESLLKRHKVSILEESKKISRIDVNTQTGVFQDDFNTSHLDHGNIADDVSSIANKPSTLNTNNWNNENVADDSAFAANKTSAINTNHWNRENIADDVASVANKTLEENGFVYDKNTGLYYDHRFQCHYNPELKLYYYHQTGAYYYYDEESQSLKFYCNATSEADSPTVNNNENVHQKTPINQGGGQEYSSDPFHELKHPSNEETCKRYSPISSQETKKAKEYSQEKEEGECSDSDIEPQLSPGPVIIEAGPKSFEPDHSKHIAPCIRVLVKSSLLDNLSPGTLFIVTCTGGTLGREGDHDVLIPDQLVSKLHSCFQYVYKDGVYFFELLDMGSKNGTFLNGKRLSEALVKSEPVEITHGSVITVGSTDLLCHIHPKDETCQECEAYSISEQEKRPDLTNELTLREKYNNEITVIRKKFGLVNSFVKLPSGYEDRSELRRRAVGSSHPSEKTQASSVDISLDKQNKGFALMTKMGWVEGTGIGKKNGIVEPIYMESNDGKTGFGCAETSKKTLLTNKEAKKKSIAKKTLERFHQSQ